MDYSDRNRLIVEGLNSRFRRGWCDRGIPDELGETNLAHTIRLMKAAVSYCSSHAEYDLDRALISCWVHELPELIIKDYTPFCKIKPEEKLDMEKQALLTLYVGSIINKDIYDFGLSYLDGKTKEDILVRQLDKLDPCIRAMQYEKDLDRIMHFYDDRPVEKDEMMKRCYPGIGESEIRDAIYGRLQEFFTHKYTTSKLSDPYLIEMFTDLMDRRHEIENHYDEYFRMLGC